MRVLRGGLLVAFALAVGRATLVAAPGHVAPSRPQVATTTGTLQVRMLNGLPYVALSQIGRQLGLKVVTKQPGRIVGLLGRGARAEFEADTRDVMVNGLRVFLGNPVAVVGRELYLSRTDFERCVAPMLRPGFGSAALPRPQVIVIDPGHGGIDIGGPNPRVGIVEKDVTLDVGLRLQRLLESDGYKVVLTRSDDRLPAPKAEDLAVRAEIANRAHADLFVSIHFNVVERDVQRTRGVEVYTFPPAGQHATDWWSAPAKNDPHLETADEPGNRFDHWNVVCAQALHRELLGALKTDDRGKKLMHLGVLRNLNCPGVLVEPAVISNDAEARKLKDPAFRQKIAEALRDGIRDYTTTLERCRSERGAATSRRRPASRSS